MLALFIRYSGKCLIEIKRGVEKKGVYWIVFCGLFIMFRRVVLIFPDNTLLSEFVVTHNIFFGEVDSINHTLTASLSDTQIEMAETHHNAYLQPPTLKQ